MNVVPCFGWIQSGTSEGSASNSYTTGGDDFEPTECQLVFSSYIAARNTAIAEAAIQEELDNLNDELNDAFNSLDDGASSMAASVAAVAATVAAFAF